MALGSHFGTLQGIFFFSRTRTHSVYCNEEAQAQTLERDKQDDLSNKDLKWLLKPDNKNGKRNTVLFCFFLVGLATVQYNTIGCALSDNVLTNKTTGSFY